MTHHRPFAIAITTTMLFALGACSSMSAQEKSTAIGVGVGAVGGGLVTGGSTAGVAAGAAVGGVVGHEVGKKK